MTDDMGRAGFCPACGTQRQDAASFCSACGHSFGSSSQFSAAQPAPAQQQATPPKPRRWRVVWTVFAVIALLLLGCGAIGGYAYGYLAGPGPGPAVPSTDQEIVIARLGDPSAWFVGDGPLAEGREFVRLEVWKYPEVGMYYEFVDGVLAEELEVTFTEEHNDIAGATPTAFDRSMTQADVEEMLGEEGMPLTMDDPAEGLDPYMYPSSRLAIAYLDGWFYIAQTY